MQAAELRCPKAAKAGKISGFGRYALLTCEDTDGIRKVLLFLEPMSRARALKRYESSPNATCGASHCCGDHISLELDAPAELVHA